MAWLFELTDLNFVTIGEVVDAHDVSLSMRLSSLDTLSFRIAVDHRFANEIAICEGFVKAYRDNVLMFFGPILSTEENGSASGATISVNCISAGWVMARGFFSAAQSGTLGVLTAQEAGFAIEQLNTKYFQFSTFLERGYVNSSGSIANVPRQQLRNVLDYVTEMSQGAGGFEWRVYPAEPFTGADGDTYYKKIGIFEAEPVMGTSKPNVIFEWGMDTRHNTLSYKRTHDRATQANAIYWRNPAPVDPFGAFIDELRYEGSNHVKWRIGLEDVVETEIVDPTLRTQLLDAHLDIRKNPRMLIEFTPHTIQTGNAADGRVPNFGTDYDLGDIIRVRAVFNGVTRFDVMIRVWGVVFALDENGVERLTMTLADQ